MYEPYTLTLKVQRYIAEPYWPEMADVIDVQKRSGMNKKQTDDTREKALLAYLRAIGMTLEQYLALEKLAHRPWYRKDNEDSKSPIMIPRHHISGCLVQACKTAPRGAKVDPENLRSLIVLSDLLTERVTEDETFRRYVRPTKDGKPLSH